MTLIKSFGFVSSRTSGLAQRRFAVKTLVSTDAAITTSSPSAPSAQIVPSYSMAASSCSPSSSNVNMLASDDGGLIDLPKVFFVLGGPGAGKGTQCNKLSSEYGLLHLSAGDLLREERNSGSSQGDLIESIIKEGNIVPSSITVHLIEKAISNSKASRILVDGFPRNMENLNSWNELMEDRMEVKSCIFIECPESELERRILRRGLRSGRSDDTKETARKRFATYKESTLPVIEHFLNRNLLVAISGDQREGEVWSDLKSVFKARFVDSDKEWKEQLENGK